MSLKHCLKCPCYNYLHKPYGCHSLANLFTGQFSSSYTQQKAHYGSQPNKKWFSRTYRPRWNWAVDKLKQNEFNMALTSENQSFIEQRALELPTNISSPLLDEPWPRTSWDPEQKKTTLRSGVIGVKIGVVPQWTVTGARIYCTMLQVLDNHVIDYKSPEEWALMKSCKPSEAEKGYGAVFVGAVSASPLEFSEEYNQLFEKSGVPPKRKITKFIVTPDSAIAPGTPLCAQHFNVGSYVDVQARTVDMGFQGVLTRWGMKGGRASHGVTKAHRRMGSMGGGGDKGGVWRGKHMPGHMGSVWRYQRGVQIVRINTKYNVLYVKGPLLPGPPRSYVRILDTFIYPKRKLMNENPPPMPTFYPEEDAVPDTPENLYHEKLFSYDDECVSYEDKDLERLHLHSKRYLLLGGCRDGKNRSYRRKIEV